MSRNSFATFPKKCRDNPVKIISEPGDPTCRKGCVLELGEEGPPRGPFFLVHIFRLDVGRYSVMCDEPR